MRGRVIECTSLLLNIRLGYLTALANEVLADMTRAGTLGVLEQFGLPPLCPSGLT